MADGLENFPKKLVQMVKEISKPEIKIRLNSGSDERYERSHLSSHFKGRPCFSVGDEWPTCSCCGRPLHLIIQLSALNNPEFELPRDADILQFFYCQSCRPYHHDEPGWFVRLVDEVDFKTLMEIDPPEDADIDRFCEINVECLTIAPSWDLLSVDSPQFIEKFEDLCASDGSEIYSQIADKFSFSTKMDTHYGGYPTWLQGVETPYYQGKPLTFVMQIDSEDDAGLNWVDMGLVYLFYEESTAQFHFDMQFM